MGHNVGRGTIANVLSEHGIDPAPERGKSTSWSTFLKAHWDSIAATDFFTVEVLTLRGFQVIAGAPSLPQQLSSDHDPLFQFHRWKANLRILEVSEIKTVPHVPISHPFVERVIGTIRRELPYQVPFWSARDLKRKLQHFRDYYNHGRVHASLKGVTPICF